MSTPPRPIDSSLLSAAARQQISDLRARIQVGFPRWLSPFIMRGVVAITLGRRVYVAADYLERGGDRVERLVRHELEHVRQVAQLGLLRFLFLYGWHYVTLRRSGLSGARAYYDHPFEIAARRAEEASGDRDGAAVL